MSARGATSYRLPLLALLTVAGATLDSRLDAQGPRLRVLFYGYVDANARVADGTGLSRLAESAYAPRWAPDGHSIFFLRGNQLMRVAASGGPAQHVGLSPYHGGPFSIGPAQ